MRIGGLGSYYATYVYNPNTLNANSMNRLSKVPDDVLDKKIDYSGLVQEENENPLEMGETLDMPSVLEQQLSEGYNRAAKIFPDGIQPLESSNPIEKKEADRNMNYQMQKAIQAYLVMR